MFESLGMQPVEYSQLRAYEDWYWWYAAQRMNLATALREFKLPRCARVLDAGCGSGAMLERLKDELGLSAHGVDVSEHAAALWNGIGGDALCRASVNALPFADGYFDAVYSVDVLGCRGVDRRAAVSEMARVLSPRGMLALLVPAYQWMLSAHDAAVHSVHRFTRAELAVLVERAGFEVVRVTHRFPLFFPAIAAVRIARKLMMQAESAPAGLVYTGAQLSTGSTSHVGPMAQSVRSDLRPIPGWLNRTLLAAARIEHAVVRGVNVPFGSTILLTARKVGA